jgi:hypothetical protein
MTTDKDRIDFFIFLPLPLSDLSKNLAWSVYNIFSPGSHVNINEPVNMNEEP